MPLGIAILSCALATGTCHAAADPGVRSFAIRVTAPALTTVRLSALDVPRGWTASFCTPRVCSPFQVALPLHGGNGTIQLSYVPASAGVPPLRVLHVGARAASASADARRTVVQ
jgi:hypothetical protein